MVILRHSERLDHVDPTYKETDEGRAWPFDTPLTTRGVELAQTVASELLEVHDRAPFAMIASSPYRRCMQTAAEVAKALNLPVIIDQEMGEVWDEEMPESAPPHRSPKELQAMAAELGIRIHNPPLPEGGYKLFGKRPQSWPETLEMGHKRLIVRMQTYIEQSAVHRQNFIIVSHAPAVAAMLDLFQRGACNIDKLEYCARVIAMRTVRQSVEPQTSSVFAEMWDVTSKGVTTELNIDATEEQHKEFCDETQAMASKRREGRTQTDKIFDDSIKDIFAEIERTRSSTSSRGSGRAVATSSSGRVIV